MDRTPLSVVWDVDSDPQPTYWDGYPPFGLSLPFTTPPDLSQLAAALDESAVLLARVDQARRGAVSVEGGDVGAHGSSRLVTRHVANYLAAVDLASRVPGWGPVVDVGSGVGGLGAWASLKLEAPLWLVDTNETALAIASQAFPDARVEHDVDRVPPGSARLVTAMEVIEHIRPREQPRFVRQLTELLAPGGLLVMSTPDESRYVGGWSGYPPHVGPLSFTALTSLLVRNTRWPVQVWRLEGQPFELGRIRVVTEPVVNRVWGACQRLAPTVTDRVIAVGAMAGRLRNAGRTGPAREGPIPKIHATTQADGRGTGLLGVVQRPDS